MSACHHHFMIQQRASLISKQSEYLLQVFHHQWWWSDWATPVQVTKLIIQGNCFREIWILHFWFFYSVDVPAEVNDSISGQDLAPKCLSCSVQIQQNCLYVGASFASSAQIYLLSCSGPGVPTYTMRSTPVWSGEPIGQSTLPSVPCLLIPE